MMIDLVFDYMAAKGVVFYSQEEMKTAEAGIRGMCTDCALRAGAKAQGGGRP